MEYNIKIFNDEYFAKVEKEYKEKFDDSSLVYHYMKGLIGGIITTQITPFCDGVTPENHKQLEYLGKKYKYYESLSKPINRYLNLFVNILMINFLITCFKKEVNISFVFFLKVLNFLYRFRS